MLSPIQKTIVNDIDLDKLTDLVEEAAVNPSLGFEVTTRWTGQFRSESRPGPITMGNGDKVPRDHIILAEDLFRLVGQDDVIPRNLVAIAHGDGAGSAFAAELAGPSGGDFEAEVRVDRSFLDQVRQSIQVNVVDDGLLNRAQHIHSPCNSLVLFS